VGPPVLGVGVVPLVAVVHPGRFVDEGRAGVVVDLHAHEITAEQRVLVDGVAEGLAVGRVDLRLQ
jgi:hypothetical protein